MLVYPQAVRVCSYLVCAVHFTVDLVTAAAARKSKRASAGISLIDKHKFKPGEFSCPEQCQIIVCVHELVGQNVCAYLASSTNCLSIFAIEDRINTFVYPERVRLVCDRISGSAFRCLFMVFCVNVCVP